MRENSSALSFFGSFLREPGFTWEAGPLFSGQLSAKIAFSNGKLRSCPDCGNLLGRPPVSLSTSPWPGTAESGFPRLPLYSLQSLSRIWMRDSGERGPLVESGKSLGTEGDKRESGFVIYGVPAYTMLGNPSMPQMVFPRSGLERTLLSH